MRKEVAELGPALTKMASLHTATFTLTRRIISRKMLCLPRLAFIPYMGSLGVLELIDFSF